MKMHSAASLDESVNVDRSAHVTQHADYSSRHPKEQILVSKNAQTENEAHLLQSATYPSMYGLNRSKPLEQDTANHVNNLKEDRQNTEKLNQKHAGVNTHNIDSLRRHLSTSCVNLRLCCMRLCRAKKRYSERVFKKPTRRVLQRIKARSKKKYKESEDTVAVAGASTAPQQESISYQDVSKKSRKSRKQDEGLEIAEKDTSEDAKKERREKRKREREERKRKVTMREERVERRERRKREEQILHAEEIHPVARDDDLVVENWVQVKLPPSIADFTKTCCYLCAQSTLLVQTAVSKPEQSDKSVQVSAHKFRPETLDKSCSPLLLARTTRSSVKVETREASVLCPGTSAVQQAKKRKKFVIFPGLTRTKCPAGPRAACETDKPTTARRNDNMEKRVPRRCCREKNV